VVEVREKLLGGKMSGDEFEKLPTTWPGGVDGLLITSSVPPDAARRPARE